MDIRIWSIDTIIATVKNVMNLEMKLFNWSFLAPYKRNILENLDLRLHNFSLDLLIYAFSRSLFFFSVATLYFLQTNIKIYPLRGKRIRMLIYPGTNLVRLPIEREVWPLCAVARIHFAPWLMSCLWILLPRLRAWRKKKNTFRRSCCKNTPRGRVS